MSKPKSPALSHQILDEASTWFVEMNERPHDLRAREAFNQWLRTSPEHVRAFLLIAAHWEESAPSFSLNDQRGKPIESIDELIALARTEESVVPLTTPYPATQRVERFPHTASANGKRHALRLLAVAASIVIAVAVFGTRLFIERDTYTTGIGEQRSLRLDDGSTVALNARSRIRVRYSEHERHIDLIEGQALFQVARNKARPFIVRTDDTQVRAVGTEFDVYRKRSGTVVTVIEGQVAVADASMSRPAARPRGESAAMPNPAEMDVQAGRAPLVPATPTGRAGSGSGGILIAAGEQLRVSSERAPSSHPKPEPVNIAAATAWTQRRLVFSRTPLAEVVEEFNRYNPVPLVITDPTLSDTEISGSFSSSDPSSLLRFLREIGTYRIRETGSATEISRR